MQYLTEEQCVLRCCCYWQDHVFLLQVDQPGVHHRIFWHAHGNRRAKRSCNCIVGIERARQYPVRFQQEGLLDVLWLVHWLYETHGGSDIERTPKKKAHHYQNRKQGSFSDGTAWYAKYTWTWPQSRCCSDDSGGWQGLHLAEGLKDGHCGGCQTQIEMQIG